MTRKKILFVAMHTSIHTVRWCRQLSGDDWDLHLFAMDSDPAHPELQGITLHQPRSFIEPLQLRNKIKTAILHPKQQVRKILGLETKPRDTNLEVKAIYKFPVFVRAYRYLDRVKRIRFGFTEMTAPAAYGPATLAKLIRKLKPDLIHSLEFQHCGYNVLYAKELYGEGFPMWLATNWGSDIYYYRQFELHRNLISRLLKNANYYSCECARDLKFAKELGFAGKTMPVMPNTGGIDLEKSWELRNIHPVTSRKIIMVKGYQSFAGRALTALEAIERCLDNLNGFKVLVYSASYEIYYRVNQLKRIGIDIEILPRMSHDDMLRLFNCARVYLGVSVSDGISTSLLEAMAMGTFPIQTNTSCCDEWIQDGKSGFEIPVDDINVIANRLNRALVDNELVEAAAKINWETISARLNQDDLKIKANSFYKTIFSEQAVHEMA